MLIKLKSVLVLALLLACDHAGGEPEPKQLSQEPKPEREIPEGGEMPCNKDTIREAGEKNEETDEWNYPFEKENYNGQCQMIID